MATERKDNVSAFLAAVYIQKIYRGYRARRQIADAVVMSDRSGWWNVVETVVLHHHTQEYYAHSKSHSSSKNWARLRKKASKVGKGLSKDSNALKLALQHWLEAVDARHRYGHNLRPYYQHWAACNTEEPFFYWLDVGGGREVELTECSRFKLQKEQIKYLSPEERKPYEVLILEGKLYYKSTGNLVHTPEDDRWIFVMSPAGDLYVGKKEKGRFQHSSFLAGGATIAAGRLKIQNGVLELMEAHSGHYRPSPENFQALIRHLIDNGADLTLANVQLVPDDILKLPQPETSPLEETAAGEIKALVTEACAEEDVAETTEAHSFLALDSVTEEETLEQEETQNSRVPKLETKTDDVQEGDKECVFINIRNSEIQPLTNDLTGPQDLDTGISNSLQESKEEKPEEIKIKELLKHQPPRTLQSQHKPSSLLISPPTTFQSQHDPPSSFVLPVTTEAKEKILGQSTIRIPQSQGYSRILCLRTLSLSEQRRALKAFVPADSPPGVAC